MAPSPFSYTLLSFSQAAPAHLAHWKPVRCKWSCQPGRPQSKVGGEERGAQGCNVLQTAEVRDTFPSLHGDGEGIWGWCPWLIQSGRLGQLLLPPVQTLKDTREGSACSPRSTFWQLLGLKALKVHFFALDRNEL